MRECTEKLMRKLLSKKKTKLEDLENSQLIHFLKTKEAYFRETTINVTGPSLTTGMWKFYETTQGYICRQTASLIKRGQVQDQLKKNQKKFCQSM